MKDICFIGHITRDHVITPTTDVYMAGGTSYYCARALKSLPPKVSYSLVTATGDDNEQVIEAMRKDDIDVKRFVPIRCSLRTAMAAILTTVRSASWLWLTLLQ